MKEFSCGDVVPGCRAKFNASSEDEILRLVGEHAKKDHGLSDVSADLVRAVRERIREQSVG